MTFAVFIGTIVLIVLGVWMLGKESFWLRLFAILPLLGSFAMLLESFHWLNLSTKVSSFILVIVVIIWGVALVQHKNDPAGKVTGAIVLLIGAYAALYVLGVKNLWLAEDILTKTLEVLRDMFSWASNAYEGMR